MRKQTIEYKGKEINLAFETRRYGTIKRTFFTWVSVIRKNGSYCELADPWQKIKPPIQEIIKEIDSKINSGELILSEI